MMDYYTYLLQTHVIFQVGIPSNGDGRWRKINRKVLDDMNLAQLQVLVNDLHTQIESEWLI